MSKHTTSPEATMQITARNYREYLRYTRNAKERNVVRWHGEGTSLVGIAHNLGRGSSPASVERTLQAVARRAAR